MHRRRAPAAAGSTYILALLVLLVLTIAGLTLSLLTQSEMQIGLNERLSQRAFYAANSGVDLSIVKALVIPDLRSMRLDVVEPTELPGLNVRHRLDMSPFVPLFSAPCNLCQINQDVPFDRVNHLVAVTATRIAWTGAPDNPPADPTPLAQKRLGVQVAFQPWMRQTGARIDALRDPHNRGGLKDAI